MNDTKVHTFTGEAYYMLAGSWARSLHIPCLGFIWGLALK